MFSNPLLTFNGKYRGINIFKILEEIEKEELLKYNCKGKETRKESVEYIKF